MNTRIPRRFAIDRHALTMTHCASGAERALVIDPVAGGYRLRDEPAVRVWRADTDPPVPHMRVLVTNDVVALERAFAIESSKNEGY